MYKFPEDKLQSIKRAIDEALDKEKATPIAAFDADGTLWATDMGESFYKYQFGNELLEGLPEDPWQFYLDMYSKDRSASYLWLAQINKGIPLEQVRTWAREAVKTHPDMGVFAGQQEVIRHLILRGVEVYVVTASVKWAVEPAAELMGIKSENVIGIETQVERDIVTDVQKGPITHGQGKVDGLLERTNGQSAFLTGGNTKSDLALLESASHLRIVLNSAPRGHDNFDTEMEMQALAKERGWFNHSFI